MLNYVEASFKIVRNSPSYARGTVRGGAGRGVWLMFFTCRSDLSGRKKGRRRNRFCFSLLHFGASCTTMYTEKFKLRHIIKAQFCFYVVTI